ncbi:helix-turn-helix domain-containing protein [Mycolicibacter sp. MYC123]|uniref:Helix-turn-helix domain-containing protein n=2 Tax=Mycolicibacter TaxID=1073531 RepID=A0ABU5YMI5_9MYCO|nr:MULTISPECIES: helix-turn-helix domain-containing protein [unclassified Mycolicibacter]MEB3051274.1 helix-turn-helix domain-containing protein [Mycolicibacter sp. MYC123]MEB3064882.1 helix-turn-helix domain-containing protein [Mycolicibacter sp. MYC101]MEB3071269.1 helix-turn-helix domain-containing protein [Mycolicibacter sp. MYC017]
MSNIAKLPGPPGGRRLDVLRLLQAAEAPLSIAQIADELGVHPNTVRFHLDTLVEEGRVEHTEPDHKGRGRPALMFQAIRQMDRGGTRHFRLLAEILTIGLAADQDPSGKALAAGREWGRRLRPADHNGDAPEDADTTDQLVDMLDELGFAPERLEPDTAGQERLGLRHCPFLELAEEATNVVCPIHLGLMQGALESIDASMTVDRLDPFAQPDLCVAHLKSSSLSQADPADGAVG